MTQKVQVTGELLCYSAYDAEVRFSINDAIQPYSAPVQPDISGQTGTFPVQLTAIFDDQNQLLAVDNITIGGGLS